jgi:membrane fusion protein (multidrug efflux system)
MAAVIPNQTRETGPGRARISPRKAVKWLIVLLILAIGAYFGYRYWHESTLYATTENAYVNTDRADIAAQVSGPVAKVYVTENQPVKAGEPLLDIDPRSYQVALEKANAQLQLANQSVSQQDAAVAAAQAQVVQRQAELDNAEANYRRTRRLVEQGFLSEQGGETARTQVATATATLHAAQANLQQARSALGTKGDDNATIQAAVAAVEQAKLDLQRTHVVAPADGVVTNLTLRPGDVVQPGAPLFVIISNQHFWIDANFKETELNQIRPGETATIEVDMYPGREFHGVVESLSGGSGTAFSLLPPQNATGNWVKVTQRVPVRIRVTDPDPQWPLRVGTTATVKVSLRNPQQQQQQQ